MPETSGIKNRNETIIVLVSACILVYLRWPYLFVLWLALALAALSIFFPKGAGWLHLAWFRLARIMGLATGKILLLCIYLVFILPVALILKSKFSIHFKKNDLSYFKTRNHRFVSSDLANPW